MSFGRASPTQPQLAGPMLVAHTLGRSGAPHRQDPSTGSYGPKLKGQGAIHYLR